jgi:hypothetical protein
MRNLFDIYNVVFSDKSKWRYYSKMNINPFNSDYDTKEFITRFIELSGKAEQNPLYDNINKLDNKRIRHIVSTFFLGTYLYYNVPKIKGSIDIVVKRFKKQNPYSKIEFSFIWFIICLFHDLGYSIENHDSYKSFDDFIEGKVKYFLKERVGVPALYENVYKDYFNYRLNSTNDFIRKPDHGICGGVLLFNKLNEILIKKQKNKKSEGLSWNPKLVNIYRYASWVILSHNIFFIRKGDADEKTYRDNNLHDLILEKHEESRIHLSKHGFLFLFALVDTIDPIKTLESYENLNKIRCEVGSNKITFELNDSKFRNDYFDKVCDLKKWVIPKIKVAGNKLEITI